MAAPSGSGQRFNQFVEGQSMNELNRELSVVNPNAAGNEEVLREQQQIADLLYQLKIVPKQEV